MNIDNLRKYEAQEKHTQNFLKFIAKFRGQQYNDAIISEYPLAEVIIKPPHKLYELKNGQSFCCGCGCGDVEPILVPYVTEYVVSSEGVQSIVAEGYWVSPCTANSYDIGDCPLEFFDLEIWDENIQNTVKETINK